MAGLRGIGAFFDGFNQGYDSTGRVLRDVRLQRIANEKPEDIYQPDQSNVGPMPDGGALSQVQAAGPDVRTSGVRFLGQTYDQGLTESQLANARMRAMADVVARNDPITGMRMRQQLAQGERDDIRFDREGQRFDTQLQEDALRLKSLRRADTREQRVEDYDEAYKKHLKTWNDMGDDEKSALISKLSYDTNVKGFGTWVPGKGKQAGYMTYLPPGGDPIKLSNAEASQVYALTNLMQVDPTRARAEMEKVSANVRAMAAQAFEAQTRGINASNTAAHYANTDQYQLGLLGIQRDEAARRKELSDLQIGEIKTARANNEKARSLLEQIQGLSPAEQMTEKGQALIRQFNVVNSKPGEQLNLGLPRGTGAGARGPVVDQKKNDDGTYTAFRKDTGEAVYNTLNGQKMPLGMSSDEFTKLRTEASQLGVPMEGSFNEYGQYQLGFKGKDGNYYTTPMEAARAKAAAGAGLPSPKQGARTWTQGDAEALRRGLSRPAAQEVQAPTRPMGPAADLMAVADAYEQDRKRRLAAVSGAGGLDLSNIRGY